MNLRISTGLCGFVVAAFLAVGCPSSSEEEEKETVTPLETWRPGMSLRETFESFPDPDGGEATLTLHSANPQAWAARWRLLAESERSVDLSYFILHQDVFGMSLLGHLLERARDGVRVRLLLDAHGTKMSWTPSGNDALDELADDGIAVKMFRPLVHRYLEAIFRLSPTAAVASEHDKILVVDGARSLIGGRNVGARYFTSPERDGHVFSDTDLTITSPAVGDALVAAFEATFESEDAEEEDGDEVDLRSLEEEMLGAYHAMDAWLRDRPTPALDDPDVAAAAERRRGELERYPEIRGVLGAGPRPAVTAETRILDSRVRFGSSDDPITRALARLVRAAEDEILLASPYLVLSEDAVARLEDAASRGVEITILTNSPTSSDNALSQAFFLEQWPEILARVPTLRLYVGGEDTTLHSKVAVFDRELALVGTYNLDPTSMMMNSEVMAAVWSARFAERVARTAEDRIAAGAPAVHRYRIERDADGEPVLEDGEPVVAFGPEDHCDPSQWTKLTAYWTLLRAAELVPGFSPLL